MNPWQIPYDSVIVGALVTAAVITIQDFRRRRRRYLRKPR